MKIRYPITIRHPVEYVVLQEINQKTHRSVLCTKIAQYCQKKKIENAGKSWDIYRSPLFRRTVVFYSAQALWHFEKCRMEFEH